MTPLEKNKTLKNLGYYSSKIDFDHLPQINLCLKTLIYHVRELFLPDSALLTNQINNREQQALKSPTLRVRLEYEVIVTKDEEYQLKQVYQVRFSEKAKRPVPIQEITVKPAAGDVTRRKSFFNIQLHQPLWIGLPEINQRAPYVLPRLMEDLQAYSLRAGVDTKRKEVLEYAIQKLWRIAGDSFKK